MDLLRQATLKLLRGDPLRLACLQSLAQSGLPQSMICAGFLRNAIWDERFGVQTDWADVDVAYFDPDDLSPAREAAAEAWLAARVPVRWQVRNQARMHWYSGVSPYLSAANAVSRFPETATALAACLDAKGRLGMPVDLGLADAWAGVLRPNLRCANAQQLCAQRLSTKDWLQKWPGLQLILPT